MKRAISVAILVLAAQYAFAQTYGRMDFSLQNAQGQAISGAQVNVYTQSACGAAAGVLATLYPTASGGTPLTQPLLTDGFGHAFAYAAPACYTVNYFSNYTGKQIFPDQAPIGITAGCTGTNAISTGCTGATTAAGAALNITGVTQTGTLGTSSQVSTFPGTVQAGTVAAGTSITGKQIGASYQADQFSGADFGAKVSACVAAVIAAGGGTCDARNFTGAQTAAATLTIGQNSLTATPPFKSANLLLGNVTLTMANGAIFTIGPGSHVVGTARVVTYNPSISGTNIIGQTAGQAVVSMIGSMDSSISNVNIIGNQSPAPATGITMARDSTGLVQGYNRIEDVSINGYFTGAALYNVESELSVINRVQAHVSGGGAKYTLCISQSDILGLGVYASSTMTTGTVSNSFFQYYPTGVANSAAIYFGGGSATRDWKFDNVYTNKSDLGAFIEIETNQDGLGAIDGPIVFHNVDGEIVSGDPFPTYGWYILGADILGAPPRLIGLRIDSGGVMNSSTNWMLTTSTLVDADIRSAVGENGSANGPASFQTVANSTISLPYVSSTFVNALTSTITGGVNPQCGACTLTVSGTNTSTIAVPDLASGSLTINGPTLVNPTVTGTLASPIVNVTSLPGYYMLGNSILVGDSAGATYLESRLPSQNVCLWNATLLISACLTPTGVLNAAGGLSNDNGVLLPTTVTGYTGAAAGKVVLSTGAGFSGSCASTTTLTVVDGIITGCS